MMIKKLMIQQIIQVEIIGYLYFKIYQLSNSIDGSESDASIDESSEDIKVKKKVKK